MLTNVLQNGKIVALSSLTRECKMQNAKLNIYTYLWHSWIMHRTPHTRRVYCLASSTSLHSAQAPRSAQSPCERQTLCAYGTNAECKMQNAKLNIYTYLWHSWIARQTPHTRRVYCLASSTSLCFVQTTSLRTKPVRAANSEGLPKNTIE